MKIRIRCLVQVGHGTNMAQDFAKRLEEMRVGYCSKLEMEYGLLNVIIKKLNVKI